MKFNPYLYFDGRCEEAFQLYERVLGGKILAMMKHEGTPAASATPPEWQEKILHARMQVGDQVIMASDAPPGHQKAPQGYSINVQVDTPAEAERVFNGLSAGGSVHMPLAETFFANKFAMFNDKFGIPWMVVCEKTPA